MEHLHGRCVLRDADVSRRRRRDQGKNVLIVLDWRRAFRAERVGHCEVSMRGELQAGQWRRCGMRRRRRRRRLRRAVQLRGVRGGTLRGLRRGNQPARRAANNTSHLQGELRGGRVHLLGTHPRQVLLRVPGHALPRIIMTGAAAPAAPTRARRPAAAARGAVVVTVTCRNRARTTCSATSAPPAWRARRTTSAPATRAL